MNNDSITSALFPFGEASISIDRLPALGEDVRLPYAILRGVESGVVFHTREGSFSLTREAIDGRVEDGCIVVGEYDLRQ